MSTSINRSIFYRDQSIQIDRSLYRKDYGNMSMHAHDYLTISLVLEGSLVEDHEEQVNLAQTGSLSIKPPFIQHSDVFTSDCTILSLKIFDWEYYGFDLKEWEWLSEHEVLKYFLHLLKAENKKEYLKHLYRHLTEVKKHPAKEKKIPDWLLDAYKILVTHYREDLNIRAIAKAVHKHPVHLGRSFQAHFGVDMKAYQKRLRLHFAVSQSINTNQKLTQIAYESGFSDHSHFSRTFKKTMDLTPREALKGLNV